MRHFNRYAYANNNPYRFTDPDGRNAVTALGGVIYETGQALQGKGFDGQSVMGALADGYNGEGDGFAAAALEDASTFAPAGAIGGALIKVTRLASELSKVAKVDKLVGAATQRLKGGVLQGRIQGDPKAIISSITKGGEKLSGGRVKLKDGTIVGSHTSKKTGVATLDINRGGKIYKIRIDEVKKK